MISKLLMAEVYSLFGRLFLLIIFTSNPIITGISSTSGSLKPSTTGFALQAGESETIQASSSWNGRFWARTHCSQDSAGNFSCITGDCGSRKVECPGGSATPPVTLAEFSLRGYNGIDFYDVSLVYGFNLPLLVVPQSGTGKSVIKCTTAGCQRDLNETCPLELQLTDGGRNFVGCRSPCDVFGDDQYCCRGAYGKPDACKPSSYSLAFKNACPRAYSYVFDNSNSSLYSCTGADYIINFCPTNTSLLHAKGTMKPGDQLVYPSNIVSEGGNFSLGFFTLEYTNFSYLGIWHTADEQRRKVWIANPNSPITMIDSQVQLVMDDTGTLRILSGHDPIMNVSDQVMTSNNNTIAVLQDSGNFVLLDSGAGNQILWQSFDHPTSMLLPGMKLGFNLNTRQNWTLTSWLSLYVAASAAFKWSLERIEDSGQFVIRRHGKIYWTSGPWKNQGFRYLPSFSAHSAHKLNYISGNDGMYFTFETIGASLSMLELSPEGQIIDHANGGHPVSPYQDFCYGYERDNGCVASEFPNCRGKDKFQMESGYFVGDSSFSYDADSTISLSDCMERCWNNCSCNGFASNSNGTGCTTWTGNQQFQVDQSGKMQRIYVLHSGKSSKGRVWIWILFAVAIVIPSLVGFICSIRIRKRKLEEKEKRLHIHQLTESDGFENVDEMDKTGKEGRGLKIFSIRSLMAATNAFSRENKLGEGGFGPVYKGKLLDGREIAVKRLSRTSGQGLREFKNELTLICKL